MMEAGARTAMPVARRSTGCWLLWLRADLPRDDARSYWRGPHARYAAQVPGIYEYRQLHFSAEDHGFWPGPGEIGTAIPADWRADGMAEVAYSSAVPPLASVMTAIRVVFPDECNLFDRTLAHATGAAGGRWHLSQDTAEVGARAVVLIRRRPGLRRGRFSSFVHDILGVSLARSPETTELRTHVFLPYFRLAWPTPGVAHDNPPHRQYHAAIVIGAADRSALQRALDSHKVAATLNTQAAHCLALHAYAVQETVGVVLGGQPSAP